MSKRKRRSSSEGDTVNPLQSEENLSKVSEDVAEDIMIAGGIGPSVNVDKSTEIYYSEEKSWREMNEMNFSHTGATSFIYGNRLFILGGSDSKKIETLDLNELPGRMNSYSLPYECGYHQAVVHEQRIIHIGGYNFTRKQTSNMISELELSTSCTMEELCQMPEPRGHHAAEIFEDKVFIFGGKNGDGALDSVLEFDVQKNKCKEMQSPLLHALWDMATVCWRDKVVVLGGLDKHGRVLNDVFMYDCSTGEITAMPPMLEKRCGCSAVISGNAIVVMGGLNEKSEILKSVECFTMKDSTWRYLPDMNKARKRAIAEVLPPTRKYV